MTSNVTPSAAALGQHSLREALAHMPSPERHNIRNALVSLRNGIAILGESDSEHSMLTDDERKAVLAELSGAVQVLETQILGRPVSSS